MKPVGGWFALVIFCGIGVAQSAPPQNATELEDYVFVQSLRGTNVDKGIQVVWIPEPLQKVCLGKTAEECATIDYCLRTTNRAVSMCENLRLDVSKLPLYPRGTRPRRVMSVTFFKITPTGPWANLQKYYDNQPKGSLDRLSMAARVKARMKLTRLKDDDDLQILEILDLPLLP